jgi:hypothetical protein
MNYLLSCPCGHTLESHGPDHGCARCTCVLDRNSALQKIIVTLAPEKIGRPFS